MSCTPSPSSSSFTTSRKCRCSRSTSAITSRYSFVIAASPADQSAKQANRCFVNFSLSSRGCDAVQELHDPRKIEPAGAAVDIELVEIGGRRSKRRRRRGGAGGLLREAQILQHVGRGEPGSVAAVRRRRRDRPRHRAITG